MPRYFFHVRQDNIFLEDQFGTDLADVAAALEEAKAGAREIAADCLRANEPANGRTIEIADGAGVVLETVTVKSTVAT